MKRWVVAATLAIAGWAAPTASAELVYGVTDSSKLVTFDTGSPGTIISTVAITGLDTEEVIKGIDVRPATLQLFALGSTGQLYRIDAVSGEARAIGTPIPITIQPTTNIDVDFDPTIDRLRVVSDAEQNFIVSPNSGAVQGQTALSPAGDVTGLAHTNNGPASATYPLAPATQAYDIDTGTNLLKVHSTPPSSGTLTTVGALNVDLIGDVGFDISTASTADGSLGANAAFAVGRTADGNDRLYTVNLGSGGATEVGEIAGADRVRDIAIVPPIPQLAVLTTSQLPIEGQQLRTVRADRPGTASPAVDITGLQGGDTLIGIDRRPLDGALIGVSDGRRIYSINPATGAATQIGNTQFPALNGFAFGMDFNPVTDRIRLVSDEDENRRLNPTDGTQTATDTNLVYPPGDPFQGTNPDVTAIAHTHPFSGAASTLLFGIDTNIDTLVTIDPPDSGTVHTITGGLNVDATDENGFDIARRFNHMFAALQTSSTGGSTLFAVAVGGAAGPPVTAANANAVVIGALGLGTGRFAQGLAIVNDNVLAAAPTPEPSPTPSPTPTVTPTITPTVTPTITPTPTPKPRKRKPGLTGKVRPRRDAGAPFRFRVTGALRRPSGVSKKAGCKGKIQIRVRKGAKALARRTVRVRKTCRYSARLVLGRKAGPKGKASFRISFRGNARLKTRTITRAARYGPV